jgi:hypothetical protein
MRSAFLFQNLASVIKLEHYYSETCFRNSRSSLLTLDKSNKNKTEEVYRGFRLNHGKTVTNWLALGFVTEFV